MAAIGDPANGGGAGPQPGGRREIRWDAVPAERTNTDDFPIDFFNVTVQSGLITTTDGTGFRVSDNWSPGWRWSPARRHSRPRPTT